MNEVASRGATLMVHLLGRCNLECQHCYMGGAPDRRDVIPLDWVLEAVTDAVVLGVDQLYLTGGEPLLYPGFTQVLETAGSIDGLTVTVCTNATLMNSHLVAALAGSGCEVNISIDGDPTFHDAFRKRRGAFRRAEHGAHALRAAGVPLTIVHTVSKDNLHLLDHVATWALGVGASRFLVQPLLRLGRGDQIADRRLDVHEANDLVLRLSDVANRHQGEMRCTLVSPSLPFLRAHPCGAYVCNGLGCHRRVEQEIKKIVVREDGWILPEVTNLDHRFAIGHVDDGPLTSLIEPYFEGGYREFDALCRSAYDDILPTWPSVLVPWDQIIAERSAVGPTTALPGPDAGDVACVSCAPPRRTVADQGVGGKPAGRTPSWPSSVSSS